MNYDLALKAQGAIQIYGPEQQATIALMSFSSGLYFQDQATGRGRTLSYSETVVHWTNVQGELGTFCESTGNIYDGYDKITNIDCICQVQQANTLNKRIVGIIVSKNQFASHGDVLVRVVDDTYEIGDILCPNENGYGKKATAEELMFMMIHAIPRPKITALNVEGFDGYVACFLV